MQKIRIWKDDRTHIEVDGQEVHRVVGYTLEQTVDTCPVLRISLSGEPSSDVEGIVKYRREDLIEDVNGLQTYKMYEGDPYEYVRLDKVLEILGGGECQV